MTNLRSIPYDSEEHSKECFWDKFSKAAFQHVLAIMIIIGFFVSLGIIVYIKDLKESPSLMLLLGALSTHFGSVVQYYFGSSLNNSRRTDTISITEK